MNCGIKLVFVDFRIMTDELVKKLGINEQVSYFISAYVFCKTRKKIYIVFSVSDPGKNITDPDPT